MFLKNVNDKSLIRFDLPNLHFLRVHGTFHVRHFRAQLRHLIPQRRQERGHHLLESVTNNKQNFQIKSPLTVHWSIGVWCVVPPGVLDSRVYACLCSHCIRARGSTPLCRCARQIDR